MNIAIVEDEVVASSQLKDNLNKYCLEHDKQIDITIFNNPVIFLEKFQSNNNFDLIFIDINMPYMSGMEVCQKIREFNKHVIIIFVTNMVQYAVEGYSVNAFDFILKPINYKIITRCLDRVFQYFSKEEKTVTVKIGREVKKLNVNDIYFIEVRGHYLTWHTSDGTFEGTGSLNEVEKVLPKEYFARCNISYLVNFKHINSIKKGDIIIENHVIHITRTCRHNFMSALTEYLTKYGGD